MKLDKTPLVSIIMTVYNVENYINQSIDSILNQSYKNFELLICDDFSSDQSLSIINEYEDDRIKTFRNKENLGYLKTCNYLFKICKGEYITFQDSDDYSHKDRIRILVDEFKNNIDLKLCGSNFYRINQSNDNNIISKSDLPQNHHEIIKSISDKSTRFPILGGSVMIKKDVLETVGFYRDFFDRIGHEHVDWILRISEKCCVKNNIDNLYYYRYVSNSFSRVGKTNDFKKFYAPKITFFLRKQRLKHGEDGLTNSKLKILFDNFLKDLETEFLKNKKNIYKGLIINRFYNLDIFSAHKFFFEALKKGEFDFGLIFIFIINLIKAIIKKTLNSIKK